MKTKLVYRLYEINNGHIGLPVDQWGGYDYMYAEYDSPEDALADVVRREDRRDLLVLPTITTSWEPE